MSNFVNVQAGLRNVGSYQVSGAPWVSGALDIAVAAEQKFTFPFVTKSITIINDTGNRGDAEGHLRIYFNASSAGDVINGHHYVTLSGSSITSVTLNVKCKEIYVANAGLAECDYTVMADLTAISTNYMYPLTGSGLTDQD